MLVRNKCQCEIEIAYAQLSHIIGRKWMGPRYVSGVSQVHTVNSLLLVYLTSIWYKPIITVPTVNVRKKWVFN